MSSNRDITRIDADRPARQRIRDEVSSWYGVTTAIGSHGELSFRVGEREIGHLHGDAVAHFRFEEAVWAQLRAIGRIDVHPLFPDSKGLASRRMAAERDVDDVIALMRLNHELALRRLERRADRAASRADNQALPIGNATHPWSMPLHGGTGAISEGGL
ncbi:MAG: DUF5519 family protein [Rhizobiaceae bacterium]|nr:DUF5519 family protein [Rhizobiaceae bacterium]MCV0407809.1 DUF5519 family protein [Rhizobiaceae bacterium]